MKKKTILLDKKLSLNKATIASLTAEKQAQLAGGAISLRTNCTNCDYTRFETCVTIPPMQEACIYC
ncbi:MAG TPA: class I lanthipeptide [Chitinophaga sp.]|uniref:class I lanthipeptide n=1 Tax=Chitinophaga sp. TaxID=1869181 RepID=UPI002B6B4B21|nr:class I lanthipeptide [Chitinophaga sp.]HVI44779.1 class I lanthipeptide [Chitinophaga sp.]